MLDPSGIESLNLICAMLMLNWPSQYFECKILKHVEYFPLKTVAVVAVVVAADDKFEKFVSKVEAVHG